MDTTSYWSWVQAKAQRSLWPVASVLWFHLLDLLMWFHLLDLLILYGDCFAYNTKAKFHHFWLVPSNFEPIVE